MTTLRKMIFACLCFAFLIHCSSGSDPELIELPGFGCSGGNIPGEISVVFHVNDVTEDEAQNMPREYDLTEFENILSEYKLTEFKLYKYIPVAIIYVEEGTEMDWIETLENDERILSAEPSYNYCLN